ncbi:unnamed protein product [Polarella glacialis]|uniref:Smr domain-containing protein n=1 Tax=Polarella glacialis TaxID=89957 RepID=A0A813LKL3_POLGL|nr:unnamed protein product [Polarella glacialis]CAE8720950.1 unnamed protein product [Polarella glacialis]CAE8732194.1 unnamed protein product [Polarella glacialis]
MQASQVEVNVYHCSAAISACEKDGQWQMALNLLSLMPEAMVVPNVITYSAVISACEKGGQWQMALNLLSLMPGASVVPNEITYSAAISACSKDGQWQVALNLLSLMPEATVVPNEITYSAAISVCEKGGQWQLALNLLRLMPQLKILPNVVSYNAAMDAVSGMGVGYALFREAFGLGMYPQFWSNSYSTVNLHDMSCGAAVLAVRWWLAEVVPHLLSGPTAPKLEIITGWGKSRKEWDTTDVQDAVFQLLHGCQLPSRIDQNNRGVITIDGRQLESSDLRRLFTPPS